MGGPRDPRAHAGTALSAATRLGRWLRPPRTLRPTRAGWLFSAITLAVGFAALNTGNNLLYLVLSLMLAFLVLSGVLSESALRGISVRRSLPAELYDATPCVVGLEIANRQRRVPAFALAIEDALADPAGPRPVGRAFVLRVGPGLRERRGYRFVPNGRGELEFERFRVSTRFPFGLFVKSMSIPAAQRALVYPALAATPPPELGALRSAVGARPAGHPGTGAAVGGLRAFAPGDPPRRIHWRSSLRHGELLVRVSEGERRDEVEVRLATAGQRPDAAFEAAVRRAASQAAALLATGAAVALRTDAERLPAQSGAHGRARLLSYLARVRPEPGLAAKSA